MPGGGGPRPGLGSTVDQILDLGKRRKWGDWQPHIPSWEDLKKPNREVTARLINIAIGAKHPNLVIRVCGAVFLGGVALDVFALADQRNRDVSGSYFAGGIGLIVLGIVCGRLLSRV